MLEVGHEEAVDLLGQRVRFLAERISRTIESLSPRPSRALDIGAQDAWVTELIAQRTGLSFLTVDPAPEVKPGIAEGIPRAQCLVEHLPFKSASFDLIVMNSVFEHVSPLNLPATGRELHRVLAPNGHLVGQMPNMNYPIESHSWLPFQQFLPPRLGRWYYDHFSPHRTLNPGGINWYRNSGRRVDAALRAAGFREGTMRPARYPPEVFPPVVRRFYGLLNLVPINFDYVYRR